MISNSWNITDKNLSDINAVVRDDPAFKLLTDYIKNDWPKYKNKVDLRLRSYRNTRHELCFSDGLCLKGHKIVIPDSLRKDMLNLLHACHLVIVKCTQKARDLFLLARTYL